VSRKALAAGEVKTLPGTGGQRLAAHRNRRIRTRCQCLTTLSLRISRWAYAQWHSLYAVGSLCEAAKAPESRCFPGSKSPATGKRNVQLSGGRFRLGRITLRVIRRLGVARQYGTAEGAELVLQAEASAGHFEPEQTFGD
jgi:hypothetical protein